MDSAQTVGAAASEQPHEKRFDLIVTGMRREHKPGAILVCDSLEEVVPDFASRGFKVSTVLKQYFGDIHPLGEKPQAQALRHLPDLKLITIGLLSSQLVVEMSRDNLPGQTVKMPYPDNRIEQSRRVRPPRGSDDHDCPAPDAGPFKILE